MSYILDALRKADHERERDRGAVPGINAQPVPPSASEPDSEDGRNHQPLVWAVAGLSVLVLALLGWLFLGRDSTPSDGAADRVAAQTPGAQPTRQSIGQPNGQPITQPGAMPAPERGAYPVPPPTVPAYTPAPAPPPQPMQRAESPAMPRVDVPAALPALPASIVAAAPVPSTSTKNGNAGAATDRVLSMDELPEDVRRQLPNFSINGSKYSDTPASRMLIVNGQVFREGDRLAPDLILEQIKIKEAVLRFRGYRYSMTF